MVARGTRKPLAIRPGDTIGIIAPSSPVRAESLARGISHLEARGYRVVVGRHVYATMSANTYLAGTDAERAADLNEMFAHEEVRAILCARGGYGVSRILELLDWGLIAANPKLVIGYSDVTALHLALRRRTGLVTVHGKMVCTVADLDETTSTVYWRLLEEPTPLGTLPATAASLTTIVPGVAEGELTGGCLTLLAHLCGTPDAPDFRGRIVLLEDVGEAIYRADRYLTQLRNAGLLAEAAGFVVGTISDWRKSEPDPPQNSPETLWRSILAPLGKPIICGFPFGHEPNGLSLPLGATARLDAEARTLTVTEAATVGR